LFCTASNKRKNFTPKRLVNKPFILDETWSGYVTSIALRKEKIFIFKCYDSKNKVVTEIVNSLKENCRFLDGKDLKVEVLDFTNLNYKSNERQHEKEKIEEQTFLKRDEPEISKFCTCELNPVELKMDGINESNDEQSSSSLMLSDGLKNNTFFHQITQEFKTHFDCSSSNLTFETFRDAIDSEDYERFKIEVVFPYLHRLLVVKVSNKNLNR
jgi:protein-arginine kinase activator protein McsA